MASDEARIIDANLASYGWRYPVSYRTARKLMKETMGCMSDADFNCIVL